MSLILSNLKNDLWIFIATGTGKKLNFYWWRNLNVSPAEVYPLWYRSIDLSTDPSLKSHWITFHAHNELFRLLESLYN
jgi:hypothetical protein